MIIKLVPIKSKVRLAHVINYIATDKGRIENYKAQGIFHNLRHTELRGMQHEFEQNYDRYAAKRSNGNIGMHVILSMNPLDRQHLDIAKMDDIVSTFLEKVYPSALAFSTHHKEENHWHSHLLVSANNLMEKTSTRLSRKKLFEVHKEMLAYLQKYPELTHSINLSTWGRKLHSEKEYYMKKRNPDQVLTKEVLTEKVQDIFRLSHSSKHFFEMLEFDGFTTYMFKDRVQGIHFGDDNRKMRFSRLGIEQEHLDELDKQYERLQELEKPSDIYRGITVDRYTYEQMLEMTGGPEAVNPDMENSLEEEDYIEYEDLDHMFELGEHIEWDKYVERMLEDEQAFHDLIEDNDIENTACDLQADKEVENDIEEKIERDNDDKAFHEEFDRDV